MTGPTWACCLDRQTMYICPRFPLLCVLRMHAGVFRWMQCSACQMSQSTMWHADISSFPAHSLLSDIIISFFCECREGAAARASLLRRKTAQGIKQAQNQQNQRQQQQHQHLHQQQQQQQQHQVQQQLHQQRQQEEQQQVAGSSGDQAMEDSTPQPPAPKKRGRPRKSETTSDNDGGIVTGSDQAGTTGDAPAKRRGRPPKSASGQSSSPGQLSEASAEMLQQRTAANPRETATIGDDAAYD